MRTFNGSQAFFAICLAVACGDSETLNKAETPPDLPFAGEEDQSEVPCPAIQALLPTMDEHMLAAVEMNDETVVYAVQTAEGIDVVALDRSGRRLGSTARLIGATEPKLGLEAGGTFLLAFYDRHQESKISRLSTSGAIEMTRSVPFPVEALSSSSKGGGTDIRFLSFVSHSVGVAGMELSTLDASDLSLLSTEELNGPVFNDDEGWVSIGGFLGYKDGTALYATKYYELEDDPTSTLNLFHVNEARTEDDMVLSVRNVGDPMHWILDTASIFNDTASATLWAEGEESYLTIIDTAFHPEQAVDYIVPKHSFRVLPISTPQEDQFLVVGLDGELKDVIGTAYDRNLNEGETRRILPFEGVPTKATIYAAHHGASIALAVSRLDEHRAVLYDLSCYTSSRD